MCPWRVSSAVLQSPIASSKATYQCLPLAIASSRCLIASASLEKVTREFVQKGVFTGPEYCSIVDHKTNPITVYGPITQTDSTDTPGDALVSVIHQEDIFNTVLVTQTSQLQQTLNTLKESGISYLVISPSRKESVSEELQSRVAANETRNTPMMVRPIL